MKYAIILLFELLYVICLFILSSFNMFYLILVLSNLIIMYLGVVSSSFLFSYFGGLLRFLDLWIYTCHHTWKNFDYFVAYFSPLPLLSFWLSNSTELGILGCLKLTHNSVILCLHFFSILSFGFHF